MRHRRRTGRRVNWINPSTRMVIAQDKEAADQRCKYGEIMLRHDHEYLTSQRAFEVEAQARLDAASQRRQHEKMRLEAAERAKMEELRHQAEKLAEERRIAREQALEWT
ncbi:hypothetical protein EV401DRAFT_1097242 [Pisolithus croceorrhizus]|nr:hypothetical protein EV401DRAFT_1097242 [Pisolithus croceorrhizus]